MEPALTLLVRVYIYYLPIEKYLAISASFIPYSSGFCFLVAGIFGSACRRRLYAKLPSRLESSFRFGYGQVFLLIPIKFIIGRVNLEPQSLYFAVGGFLLDYLFSD